jgi:2-succinyl-5-enolpyruvyl-6-hydroxy-3-cyclohexene-1-carboxylate synthase
MEPTPAPDDPPAPEDVAATYCATLVDEWARLGLTDAVVCPGSRSTPLALALRADQRVRVHVHHDERSGSFMALGLARVGGRPVALVCTSGTAAVQFHAAVVEASHAHVPLLVLTADRPRSLQGVGAPQTIDQRDLYGRAPRWYCEPGVPVAGGSPWWRDLARDAWSRSGGQRPGPVHLNLAFAEPLVGSAGPLPPPGAAAEVSPSGAQWGLTDEDVATVRRTLSARRGVVVAGARAARDDAGAAAVHRLAAALGWPVLADGPSGCRLDGAVTTYDPLLRHPGFASAHVPEVVLRLGGLSSSKALLGWLAASGAVQLAVDPYGAPADPDRVVAASWPADVATVCAQLLEAGPLPAPEPWGRSWATAEQAARRALAAELARHPDATEPALAVDLVELLPEGGVLVASSSMPVRDLEWYAPARPQVQVVSNRGANGIDGVVSSAVGAALTGRPTALLVGDVAFLHDTNGLLGLSRRPVDLVVVVVDNRGGGIFSFLPQRDLLDDACFEELFGTPHDVDLLTLCAAHGVPAVRARSRAGAQAAIAGALTRGGPRVVVVETDRARNVEVHRDLAAAVGRSWEASAGAR